jgi:multidrug efflux pump subunit AcrA (membrane-fusion protein)
MSRPGQYEERKVEIGENKNHDIVITQGLKAGETVVVKGSLELNGLAIKQASEAAE